MDPADADRIARALEKIAGSLDDIRDALVSSEPVSLIYQLGQVVEYLDRIAANPIQVSIDPPATGHR
jgi:hypothetical protein